MVLGEEPGTLSDDAIRVQQAGCPLRGKIHCCAVRVERRARFRRQLVNHQAAYIHLACDGDRGYRENVCHSPSWHRMAQSGFACQINVVAGRTDSFIQFHSFLRELPGLAEISRRCGHNRLIVVARAIIKDPCMALPECVTKAK